MERGFWLWWWEAVEDHRSEVRGHRRHDQPSPAGPPGLCLGGKKNMKVMRIKLTTCFYEFI